jgi:hypothetical protein
MSGDTTIAASSCSIEDVLITRLTEIKEMMEDYQQIKLSESKKGQDDFLKAQLNEYENQFEACIHDLLLKIEIADKALFSLAHLDKFQSTKEAQKFANDSLRTIRE